MAQAMLDPLGWVYIGLAIAWTITLSAGILFLHHYRHLPCLQIRRLPVLFMGVCSLHLYGLVSIMMYIIGPIMPCTVEFWIMSLYLPFGIAMFQVANSQFLHVASRQKQFLRTSTLSDMPSLNEKQAERLANSRVRRVFKGVERADKIERMTVWVVIGLAVQLALTLFVFFGSKKFHSNYGIFDYTVKGTEPQLRDLCSKGWEWWLSIVWQFFWAWIYAPYMLWKSRSVRDVHGWRIQTICCCVAGLPASPLWLCGLYVPQFAVVNRYFSPPIWFSVSIFFMEVFTIGFPMVQVLKTQALHKKTQAALALWEQQQKVLQMDGSESLSNSSSRFTDSSYDKLDEKSSLEYPRTRTKDMFSGAALDSALQFNSGPLLHFAALKDFSGENVSFIMHIAEWNRAWFIALQSTEVLRRQQFIAGVRIYAAFISLEYAEFPVNISFPKMKVFHQLFESAANVLLRRVSISSSDTITPFEDPQDWDAYSTVDLKTGINLDTLGRLNLRAVTQVTEWTREEAISDVEIPDAFTPEIFQSVEKEIKYLILTNTWPKFVNISCAEERVETGEVHSEPWWTNMTHCV